MTSKTSLNNNGNVASRFASDLAGVASFLLNLKSAHGKG